MIIKTKSPSVGPFRSGPARPRTAPPLRERPIWIAAEANWRPLYGGFYEVGISIEWHELTTADVFNWSRSFHPGSLELCLNLQGSGSVSSREALINFQPRTAGFYLPGTGGLEAWRQAGDTHRFLTVEFSTGYLRSKLGASDGALHPLVEKFLRRDCGAVGLSEAFNLTLAQQQLIEQMLRPEVPQGARPLWYESKVLQFMVDFFFIRGGEDELFCDRHKRLARERVSRAIGLLEQRLAEPPSLEELGRAVGCSPFYLSRTFSSETQMTIPQYLRKLRMERAAELLRSGKYNVTEAAMEVGYSSLSHFSQAFCQTIGCCPALYPLGLDQHRSQPQPGPAAVPPAGDGASTARGN